MSGLKVWVQGIGLLGPGLSSWAASLAVLRGAATYCSAPTALPAPARLPPAERRRAGAAVKLALAVADEAVAQAQVDAATLATVFTSSSGEGMNCHVLCETLATAAPMVSPTRFTNSVHNAAAGYWHIATRSRQPSTSLCALDASFAAGLLEANTQCLATNTPVLLVACDLPYPEPLNAVRTVSDVFAVAIVLGPPLPGCIAQLTLAVVPQAPASACSDVALNDVQRTIPAARALPLLQALARGQQTVLLLEALPGMSLQLSVASAG